MICIQYWCLTSRLYISISFILHVRNISRDDVIIIVPHSHEVWNIKNAKWWTRLQLIGWLSPSSKSVCWRAYEYEHQEPAPRAFFGKIVIVKLQLADPTQLQVVGVGVDFVFWRKEGRKNPHLASSRRNDPSCLNFGDCLVGFWKVFGNYLEGVWHV